MKQLAAVVTDAINAEFYFPAFHAHYSRLFGAENLYVLTGSASPAEFRDFNLGGIMRLGTYNNDERCSAIAAVTSMLLSRYSYVIRVDTDEFAIPDPRQFRDLRHYLEQAAPPYVTSMGYNVVCKPADAALDFNQPILGQQRSHCYPYDALNKTCITSIPIHWAPGFHFASVFPRFEHLYLFHFKYADLDTQVAIGEAVASQSNQELFQTYHRTTREQLDNLLTGIFAFPAKEGWSEFDRKSYNRRFIENVGFVPAYGGVYHGGAFAPEAVLLSIPPEFGQQL